MRALQQLLCWTAVAIAVTACSPSHGDEHGAFPGHADGAAASDVADDDLFAAKPPPFSEGIFPCSRCHEGGPQAPEPEHYMPHASHLAKGLECADCHMPEDEAEPQPADQELCAECHEDEDAQSQIAAAYFAAYTDDEGDLQFPDRWKTRDIKPVHETHIDAEIECSACHGKESNAAMVKPKSVTLMNRCTACHEERNIANDCATCHTEPRGEKAHDFELDHAEDQRGCLDCHNPDDRDTLRLANGTAIGFGESFRLCGQCHGPKLRDWKAGLHGKRMGLWNGRKEYLLCAHCHNPHAPAFGEMDVLPPPPRPEEMR